MPRFLFAVFLCLFSLALGARENLPPEVAQALARAGVPLSNVALTVQSVDAARPSLSLNAQTPMNPASVMKLVTTFAAFEILGPTFNWRTEVYLGGPLKDGVLQGDLILKGYGDPQLTFEKFWLLIHELRARGVREIRGDLVLDRSYFALDGTYDPAGFDNEPTRPYNVGADALMLNYKTARFNFRPQPASNSVQIIFEPPLAAVDIDNQLGLSKGACGNWRHALNFTMSETDGRTQLHFRGNYPIECGERNWNIALFTHQRFMWSVFKAMWQQAGGVLRGSVRDGLMPPNAIPFVLRESPPLPDVLRDMNKFSNNAIAKQVFLTLGAEALQMPGRYDRSAMVVRDWLNVRGTPMPDLILENGSGLSRNERISAADLLSLLIAAYRSPLMPEFISTLPLVARDGTMQRRLKAAGVAGQAHVKTGSLDNVRSIAGFVLDQRGQRSAFVFIVNHPNASATREAQDALLRWLYQGGAGVRGAN